MKPEEHLRSQRSPAVFLPVQRQSTPPRAITEADTLPLPVIRKHTLLARILPAPVQHCLEQLFRSIQDPEPESWSRTLRQKALILKGQMLGWFPLVILLNALGMVFVVHADAYSLHTSTDGELFLWAGLLIIFAPAFLRLLSPLASRGERVGILCSTAISIYLVKVLLDPIQFLGYDEYLHWQTVNNIVTTGHLFSENSLLPVSPRYPGLEILTDAVSALTGLSTFIAGLIVVGLAHLLMTLALFFLYEQLTRSARVAGLATVLYMCNAGFFGFDSLFIYEALALALGVFVLFVLTHLETIGSGKRTLLLIACLTIGALTATHHVADFFFIGLLILWVCAHKLLRQPVLRSPLTLAALVGIGLAFVWVMCVARPVIDYLYEPVSSSVTQLEGILSGNSAARHLFIDYTGGHPTALWQRFMMLAALSLITLGIPFGAICLWHRYRRKAFIILLGMVALAYPITQAFRLTGESANIADRSSPYIFIAVGFVLALLITQVWPVRKLKWKQKAVLTTLASIIFLGSNMLGAGPTWVLLPGNYVVGDDARSIDPESIQAAEWTLTMLGPNNRIVTDRSNSLAMSTYGEQLIVTPQIDGGIYVSPVLYATNFAPWETTILCQAQVQYLVIDTRISTALPLKGYYFEEGEPEAANLTRPISRQALTKFSAVPQINRIFDSGDIVIYGVGDLTNASQ